MFTLTTLWVAKAKLQHVQQFNCIVITIIIITTLIIQVIIIMVIIVIICLNVIISLSHSF